MKRISALLHALTLVCCSGGDATAPIPPAVDHDAQGSWGANSHGVITPGFTFLPTFPFGLIRLKIVSDPI